MTPDRPRTRNTKCLKCGVHVNARVAWQRQGYLHNRCEAASLTPGLVIGLAGAVIRKESAVEAANA